MSPGLRTIYAPPPPPSLFLRISAGPLSGTGEREPTWRRFLKAFCVAVIIYMVLGIAVKISHHWHPTRRHLFEDVPEEPRESDGRILHCATNMLLSEADQQPSLTMIPPYSSKVSFSVPVSASVFFLLSRGSYDHKSSVRFELSENSGNDIKIDVDMSYYSHEALNHARVCLLERDNGGRGVGFFTPSRSFPGIPRRYDQIKFTTTVRFPRSGSTRHPLFINAVETRLGFWSHYVASLENQVMFRSISLHASNSPMHVEHVSAGVARLQTSNAPITGSYNVSDSLALTTSNSPITASIRLENGNEYKPTRLEVTSSNGRIQTPVTLISTDNSSSPAAFSVSTTTSNSALDVVFPDAPSSPFSRLQFTGKTSNAPAGVKLHATYEGSISLRTSSVFRSELVQTPGREDPSGEGRQRTVDVRRSVKGIVAADVWWGDAPNQGEEKGTVRVTTSNSNAVAKLD